MSVAYFRIIVCSDTTEAQVFSSELRPGGVLEFGKRSIEFKEVISDSRCPDGVTCIWEGEARILVEYFEKGRSLGDEIIVVGSIGSRGALFNDSFGEGLKIRTWLELKPHPKVSQPLESSDYSLKLRIALK